MKTLRSTMAHQREASSLVVLRAAPSLAAWREQVRLAATWPILLLISCGSGQHGREQPAGDFEIRGAEVRACDILLEVGDEPIDSVRFEDCSGAYYQRAPKLGISVSADADAALGARGAIVLLPEGRSKTVALASAQCFDRQGRPLEGERVVLR